jgi:hypothetical protein
MAIHTQNVLTDPRASLLVMQSGSDSGPLGLARATLLSPKGRRFKSCPRNQPGKN